MMKFRLFSASLAMMTSMAMWAGPVEDLAGASYDNPLDATSYIVNATCESHDGWTELPSAWGSQPAGGAHYESDDATSVVDGFIERWVKNNQKLSDCSMSQVLVGMPKGAYKLTVDIIATQQGNQNLNNTGAFVYAGHDGKVSQVEVSTLNAKPKKITVPFYVEKDGDVTVGFKTESTTCNWIVADNYKLEYYGETVKVMQDDLAAQLEAAKTAIGEARYYTDLQTEFTNLSTEIQQLVAKNDATLQEVYAKVEALSDMKAKILANVAAYNTLNTTYNDAISKMENGDIASDAGQEYLFGFMEEKGLEDILNNYSLGTEDVQKLKEELVDAVWKAKYYTIAVGDKVTINNPSFSKMDGETEVDDASGWSGTAPSVRLGIGEAYAKKFDTYQELKGLPNGKYTLKLNSFFRTNNNVKADTTFTKGICPEVRAMAYINAQTQPVVNLMADAVEASELEAIGATTDGCYETKTGKYVPNDRDRAKIFFEQLKKYQVEVSGLVTDGVLRFGVKLENNSGYDAYWCTYDNFELTYASNDIADMQDIRDNAVAQAQPLLADDKLMSADVKAELDKAVAAVNNATTVEDLGAAINALQEKITAANTSVNTYATLTNAMAASKTRVEANKTFAGSYKTNYEVVEANVNAGIYTDEDIPAAIANVNKFTTQYLMEGVAGTEASPADVTFVIDNADFGTASNTETNKKGNTDGWTKTQNGGANAVNYNCQEFFNNNSFQMSQKLYGLPAGKYTLGVQGYYRPGDNNTMLTEANINTHNVKLFAGENESTVKLLLSEAFDAQPDAAGNFVVLAEGTDYAGKYVPNDMQAAASVFAENHYTDNEVVFEVTGNEEYVEIGAKKDARIGNDWTIFRRFTLSYVGNNATGISNVDNKTAEVKNVEFYSVDGKRLAAPVKSGVTIVKKTMADGTVKVEKLLSK